MSIDMPIAETNAQALDLLRREIAREHDLLNSRTNIFLLWQAILMAGYAIGTASYLFHIILSVLGIFSCLVWLYVGHLSRVMIKAYWIDILKREESLPETTRFYTMARHFRRKHRSRLFGLSVTKCMTYVFPIVWIVAWVLTLLLIKV